MKRVLILFICLLLIGSITPYCAAESVDEPEMWKVIGNPEMEEEYKKSHPFLDDMCYWQIEHPGKVQYFGYSRIRDVLAVTLADENGKETLYYADVEDWIVDQFKQWDDADHFYDTFIDGYLQRLEIVQIYLPNA